VPAWAVLGGTLGMILDDPGVATRDATDQDAAHTAVRLHAAPPAPWLPTLNTAELAALPSRALALLADLRANGRFPDGSDLADHLAALDGMAAERADGAELSPYGMCHGELHPTAVHIGPYGRRHLLDFAMSHTGPGLLDLAAWTGLRRPADTIRTRNLIQHYVNAGGQ
jgi:aminoglycoside phosphotransferase (APT) family kinase protein